MAFPWQLLMGLWGSGQALKEEGSVGSYVASKCTLYFAAVVQMLNCVGFFVTPACQTPCPPLSPEFVQIHDH